MLAAFWRACTLGPLITCLLLSLPLESKSATSPFSGVEVCGDYTPWTEGACTVDAEGVERGYCRRCLVGPEWDALRDELGTNAVAGRRRTMPVLASGNWPSSTMLTTAFRIIARELLGYDRVQVFTNHGARLALDEVVAEGCQAINLEVWKSNEPSSIQKVQTVRGSVAEGSLGTSGYEGLYAPAFISTNFLDYDSLRNDPGSYSDFPRDGSTASPEHMAEWLDPPHFGCHPDVLKKLEWVNSSCVAGRWYPPQCGSEYPSPQCRELYAADPRWVSGMIEGVTKNLGFNFSVVYLGYQGLVEAIGAAHRARRGALYYWWEPDPLLSKYPSKKVQLPPHSVACAARNHPDPARSGYNCSLPVQALRKYMNREVYSAEPDLAFLFDRFLVDKEQMMEMMSYITNGGGAHNLEDGTCAFLRSGSSVPWRDWLQITPPPVSAGGAQDVRMGLAGWVTAVAVLGAVMLMSLLLVAALAVLRRRGHCLGARYDISAGEGNSGGAPLGSSEPSSMISACPKQGCSVNSSARGKKGIALRASESGPTPTSLGDTATGSSAPPRSRRNSQSVSKGEGGVLVIRQIGSGATSIVYHARWHGVNVALKVMQWTGGEAEELGEETRLAESLRHPNVVQQYGFELVPATSQLVPDAPRGTQVRGSSRAGSHEGMRGSMEGAAPRLQLQIIQEFCSSGSLKGALKEGLLEGQVKGEDGRARPPHVGTALTLAHDIALGMAYIHSRNVLHSDLKASNVLLTERSQGDCTADCSLVAKVADFGLSRQMDVEVTHVSGVFSGTVTHMAPETLRVGQQSKAADVYAFGILLYELFTADSAYRGLPQTAIIDMVLNRRARPVLPPDTPRHVALLAANCMEEEPGRRPSMAAVRDQLATLAQQYATQPAPTVTARQVGDERMVLDTPCDGAPCSGTTAREGGDGSNECDGGASMLSDGEGLPPRMRVPSVFVGDKELTLVPSHPRRPSAPVGFLNALREGDEGSGREDSEEEQSTLMFVASFMPTGNDDTTETSSACHNKKDGVGEASLV